MDSGVAGKTVVVTGATGMLGRAISRAFVDEKVRAIALVDLDHQRTKECAAEFADQTVEVVPIALDVTDHDAVQRTFDDLAAMWGRIDIAINNAGIVAPSARLHNVRSEDFRRVLDVNLTGVFNCMKAEVNSMRTTGGGAVVNTASVAGFTNWTHSSPYGASKAAVIQLTKLAAAEYAREGIRVNCVCPGTFLSSFHEELPESVLGEIRSRHPLGRFGNTDEIAAAYVYLAGASGQWITGTSLVIDGGMSAG